MAGRKENEARTSLIEKKEDESSGSSDREEDNETTGLQPWTCRLASDHEEEDRSVATARLSKAVIFCLVFMVVEVAGGVWANSLAILTDAAHMLSDVASFAISLFALWAASWDATPRRSYGFHRLEILGALLSIQIIWLITGILVYEAVDRLIHETQPVDGKLMCVIAALGLVVNLAMIFLLGHGHEHGGEGAHSHGFGHSHGVGHGHDHAHAHNHAHDHDHDHGHNHDGHNHGGHHDHHEQLSADDPARPVAVDLQDGGRSGQGTCIAYAIKDGKRTCQTIKVDQDVEHGGGVSSGNINVRGAYLHVLGDLIQSIGVLIAGAVIWYKPDWQIVDPVCTLLFAVLVLFTTIRILRDILDVLMENTPREIDAQKLEAGLSSIQDVVAVHELHIWAITVGKTLLACHVTIQPGADYSKVLEDVIAYCRTDFKISHVTVQIEVARDVGGSQQALSHC